MAREEGFFDELARGLAEGSISRRRALGLFASSAIAALVPSTRALADDDGYTVCHVPGRPPNCDCTRARTIRGLSRRERNRHLRNHTCDSRGNCRNNPYCGTTTTTSTTSTTTTPTPMGCTADTTGCCAGGGNSFCSANASGTGTTCWTSGTCIQPGVTGTPQSCADCGASQACVILPANFGCTSLLACVNPCAS